MRLVRYAIAFSAAIAAASACTSSDPSSSGDGRRRAQLEIGDNEGGGGIEIGDNGGSSGTGGGASGTGGGASGTGGGGGAGGGDGGSAAGGMSGAGAGGMSGASAGGGAGAGGMGAAGAGGAGGAGAGGKGGAGGAGGKNPLDAQYTCRTAVTAAKADLKVTVIGTKYDSYQAPDDVYLVDCRVWVDCSFRRTLEKQDCTNTTEDALKAACAKSDSDFAGSVWVARVVRLKRFNPDVVQPINDGIAQMACGVFSDTKADDVCKGMVRDEKGNEVMNAVFRNIPSFTVNHQILPGSYYPTTTFYCPLSGRADDEEE